MPRIVAGERHPRAGSDRLRQYDAERLAADGREHGHIGARQQVRLALVDRAYELDRRAQPGGALNAVVHERAVAGDRDVQSGHREHAVPLAVVERVEQQLRAFARHQTAQEHDVRMRGVARGPVRGRGEFLDVHRVGDDCAVGVGGELRVLRGDLRHGDHFVDAPVRMGIDQSERAAAITRPPVDGCDVVRGDHARRLRRAFEHTAAEQRAVRRLDV